MMRILRILGKRGRITIPYEIRQRLGFRPNEEELERYKKRFAEIEEISPQEVQAATGFFFCAM